MPNKELRDILMLRHLDRVVEGVRLALRRLASSNKEGVEFDPAATVQLFSQIMHAAIDDARGAELPAPPDIRLIERYGLERRELFILWITLASHLEPKAHDQVARANDSVVRDLVDASLCLRLLCVDRAEKSTMMGMLSSNGSLVRRGFLSLKPHDRHRNNALFHELVAHEQLPLYVQGIRSTGARLAAFARSVTPDFGVERLLDPESLSDLSDALKHYYQRPPLRAEAGMGSAGVDFPAGFAFAIEGMQGSGRTMAARALAGELKRGLLILEGRALAHAPPHEAAECLRDAVFEGELHGDLVCIRDAAAILEEDNQLCASLASALRQHRATVALCLGKGDQIAPGLTPFMLFRHEPKTTITQQCAPRLWRANIPESLVDASGIDFQSLTARVNLSPLQVRKATALSYLLTEDRVEEEGQEGPPKVTLNTPLLEKAALAQISRSIGSMATIQEPNLTIRDLIASEKTDLQIREIINAAQNRLMVLDDWGVGRRIRRGTGIIVLFDGEPGTGKTHSAEVIASELGLSLVQINISSIVDKYIGETEKNLTRIFAEARPDISVLLFDEADSLFGKRTTNVSKASDRYSNMNINVLLQLIERYEGVTVLTTNLKQAIDPAFERRFTYKIHFDMPEKPERERLWEYLLPRDVKTGEEIDYEWLSEIDLSGGEIKNAIILASYRAAYQGSLLTTEHLYDAAQREAIGAGRMVRHGEADYL